MEYVTLNNGVTMPMLGYGVYQIPDGPQTERGVRDALEVGYRLIDTAQAYGNEASVGAAIAASGIDRADLFVTTKVWIANAGEAKAAQSIDESLAKLGLDYLDLLLVHQPFGDYYGTWRAMEHAYQAGQLRAIGVSNFYPDRLIDLVTFSEVKPMVNQVETHVFFQQAKAREYMAKYGVQAESWGPFAESRNGLFTNPVLQAVADKHGKTTAQVALRFLIEGGVVVIPKSTHRERIAENLDVFDFALDADDTAAIGRLDLGKSQFFHHADPETAEMFMGFAR
ncbi:MAG: aldo/keto reductase [Propionibacteriaceae bacterium]|jgi:diketogulonate reductase-like aldo/keto reductase|nr:aldo/keto reductase [Propionibacteriaceae bacterium]